MRRFFFGLVLLSLPIATFAQVGPTGTVTAQQSHLWLQGFGTIRLDDHWFVPMEVQARRADTGRTWARFVLKIALMRDINGHVAVGGGYGYQHSWPYGAQPIATQISENRTFQQMVVKYSVKSNVIENRLRLEQRWVERIDPMTSKLAGDRRYTNRLRYRPGLRVPLHRRDPARTGPGDGDTFLFLNDEVFVNFGKSVQRNTFDQNRFAIGIGHHFSRVIFQGGYLHQYSQKGDEVRFESNHAVTLGLTYNLRLK